LLTGWNADDALFWVPATLDAYRESLIKQYGNDAEKLMKYYPASDDNEAIIAIKNLSRDNGFGIQNYAWARIQSEKGKSKAYLYFFERKVPEVGGATQYGAFHSGEITYAYDNHKMFNRPWEPADYELAKLMSSYWINFAKNGDPNGTGLPIWPFFNKDKGEIMSFDVKSATVKHPNYDALEYFYQKATNKNVK
jgi:para-nitrobenzyl esterase